MLVPSLTCTETQELNWHLMWKCSKGRNKISPNQQAPKESEFLRQREQTKIWAVCFFYSSSFLFQHWGILGNYNKSNCAVHLSNAQPHTFLPSSLCLSLLSDTRMAAGMPPSGLQLLSCREMSARRTTDKRKMKGKVRGRRRWLWNHAGKVLWVQPWKEAARLTIWQWRKMYL